MDFGLVIHLKDGYWLKKGSDLKWKNLIEKKKKKLKKKKIRKKNQREVRKKTRRKEEMKSGMNKKEGQRE